MSDDLGTIAWKIGLSALLAGMVGAQREWSGKWAGLRTHMLIAVGSALLTHVSIYVGLRFAAGSNAWDPGRIAAQIVSGVGFLGAGTIIQSRGAVRGLTTAAGLWVASAIGLAVGAEFYVEAAATSLTLLVILIALVPVERRLLRRHRQTVLLELRRGQSMSELMAAIDRAEVELLEMSRSGDPPLVTLEFQGSGEKRRRFLERLREEGFLAGEEGGEHLLADHRDRSE
jgi:putative Mg2+ transporter-C (MgtC) family protein